MSIIHDTVFKLVQLFESSFIKRYLQFFRNMLIQIFLDFLQGFLRNKKKNYQNFFL